MNLTLKTHSKMELTGKTCLITGANSGLGLTVAKRFTAHGAHTLMVGRNKEEGEQAVLEIIKENPDASAELMICDLSSMNSIQTLLKILRENIQNSIYFIIMQQ